MNEPCRCPMRRGEGYGACADEGKEERIMEKKSYVGRIKNSGTQVVEAPYQSTDTKKGTVKKGRDLRAGKK